MEYKYITDNNLENRQSYTYSEYGGREFLTAYRESRQNFILEAAEAKAGQYAAGRNPAPRSETEVKLRQITVKDQDTIQRFIKGFEVRKRLYEAYDWNTWKPIPGSEYHNLDLYLIFAGILLDFYRETKGLKYINCLLKVDDTLLSLKSMLSAEQQKKVSEVLQKEVEIIGEIMQSKLKNKGDGV